MVKPKVIISLIVHSIVFLLIAILFNYYLFPNKYELKSIVTFLYSNLIGLLSVIIFTSFIPAKHHTFKSIVIITYYFLLINIFLFYIIGMTTWSHPLSIKIIKNYIINFPVIINAIPIKKNIIYLIISLVQFLVIILGIKSKSFFNIDNINNKIKLFFAFFIFISFFALLFKPTNNFLAKRYYFRKDPLLSFFLYEPNSEDIKLIGKENIISKTSYIENASFNKKNIILIVCDAFRADNISNYGYTRNTTPFLDSLSKLANWKKVDNFFSHASRTILGISSIFSSELKIYHNNFFLHDILKKEGYNTNFFVSGDLTNFQNIKSFLGENVDVFLDGNENNSISNNNLHNDSINIINRLKTFQFNLKKPNFIYLHFMSAHNLSSNEDRFKKYNPSKLSTLKKINREILINDYDNKVLQLDNYLKEAYLILKEKKMLSNSIIIITSDHGQSLLENDKYLHSVSLYKSETKIPFYIKINDDSLKINNFGSLIDVAPTILHQLGIKKPETWEGLSLFNKSGGRNYILQHQHNDFAIIWKNNKGEINQLIYNTNSKEYEMLSLESNNNLEIKISKEELTKYKLILNKFFKSYK